MEKNPMYTKYLQFNKHNGAIHSKLYSIALTLQIYMHQVKEYGKFYY